MESHPERAKLLGSEGKDFKAAIYKQVQITEGNDD